MAWTHRDALDLDGDALPDLVRVVGSAPSYDFGVRRASGFGGLLERVDNEFGGSTEIEYQPSSWLSEESASSLSRPYVAESLPASLGALSRSTWVVESITVRDGRPASVPQVTQFWFAEPRLDLDRREYTGMRMAEQTDAIGTTVRSIFHQGVERRGKRELEEVVSGTQPLQSSESTWEASVPLTPASVPIPIPGSWFAKPVLERISTFGALVADRQERRLSRTFDAQFGNLLAEIDSGADLNSTFDDFKVVRFYAPNVSAWLVNYPSSRQEWLGSNLSKNEPLQYDGQATAVPPSRGLLTRRTTLASSPGGPTIALEEDWQHDPFGNVTEYWDPRAGATATATVTYDTALNTYVSSVKNALQHETRYEIHPGLGEVRKVLDPNGYLQCWTFDVFGRLQARSDRSTVAAALQDSCNQTLQTFAFVNLGSPGHPTAPQHLLTRTFSSATASWRRIELFDGLGRVFQEEDEGRVSVGNEFDVRVRSWGPRGEATCEALPLRSGPLVLRECSTVLPRREYTYDALLRRLVDRRQTSSSAIEEVSRAYAVRDEDGLAGNEVVEERILRGTPDRALEIARNPRAQVVAVADGAGTALEAKVLLRRDPKDRVTLVDSPDVAVPFPGAVHANLLALTYDGLDRRVRLVQPHSLANLADGPTWTFEWDSNGNLLRRTPPQGAGLATAYFYDQLDRLKVKDYSPFLNPGEPIPVAGPEDVAYTYDTVALGTGRIRQIVTPAVTTTFNYRLAGQVGVKQRTFPSVGNFAFYYIYDFAGRLVTTLYPDIELIARDYDGSVLTTVRSNSTQKIFAGSMTRHESGGLDFISHPLAAVQTDYTYDPQSLRLQRIQTTQTSTGTLADFTYGYDAASNPVSVDDSLNQLDEVFAYDALHRLASATGTGTRGYGSLTFSYDAAGNLGSNGYWSLNYGWTDSSNKPRGPTAVTWAFEGASVRAGYGYDDQGSATSKQLWGVLPATLVRDAEGRLTRFQIGSEAMDYLYDEDGRVRKMGGIGPVAANRLYVDREYESDLLGLKHQKHLFVGDQRIAITERPGIGNVAGGAGGETVLFVHSDYRGSAVLVTRSDGSVAQRAFIRPWGEAVVVDGAGSPLAPQSRVTSYLLAGTELDAESNFYSMGARHMDPVVGRFLSQDPELVGHTAGVSFARLGEGPNPYNYADNRPTYFIDPTGRFAVVESVAAGTLLGGPLVGAVILGGVGTAILIHDVYTGGPISQTGVFIGQSLIHGIEVLQQSGEGEGEGQGENRNPAQDKKLTPGEIKALEGGDVDVHDLKGGKETGKSDLYKDKQGNIYVKPKGGSGPGEPTGLNIKDF